MQSTSNNNQKPKLILLGSAVVIVFIFIVYTLVGSNTEVEAKEKDENVFLTLPTPSVNSGAMLLWNIENPVDRNPFEMSSGSYTPPRVEPRRPSTNQRSIPPLNPMAPEIEGFIVISKSVVLRGVIRVLNDSNKKATALIEIEGKTTYFKVGEQLMSGVTFTGVYDDGILLSVNGKVRKLAVGQKFIPTS